MGASPTGRAFARESGSLPRYRSPRIFATEPRGRPWEPWWKPPREPTTDCGRSRGRPPMPSTFGVCMIRLWPRVECTTNYQANVIPWKPARGRVWYSTVVLPTGPLRGFKRDESNAWISHGIPREVPRGPEKSRGVPWGPTGALNNCDKCPWAPAGSHATPRYMYRHLQPNNTVQLPDGSVVRLDLSRTLKPAIS